MHMRMLGRLWPVSVLALGGGGVGQLWGATTREECIATVRTAVERGITLLDMAPAYGNGEAESVIGAAFEASRVLVTGATGGVGYFVCQLARLMGAHVTALLRRRDQEALAKSLGVDETVVSRDGAGLDAVPKFRAIVDGVGGPTLGQVLTRLDDDGRAILYGVSAGQQTTFAIRDLMLTGNGRVEGFYLTRDIQIERASKGLSRLLKLLANGRLRTLVSIDADWSAVGESAARLMARDFTGKAVLRIV